MTDINLGEIGDITFCSWDGFTLSSSFSPPQKTIRNTFFEALLRKDHFHELNDAFTPLNSAVTRLDDPDLNTALHVVVQNPYIPKSTLINFAQRSLFRSIANAYGKTPLDVLRQCKVSPHREDPDVIQALTPRYQNQLSKDEIDGLQNNLHKLIHRRFHDLVSEHQVRLPQIRPVTELNLGEDIYMEIPGLLGGVGFSMHQRGMISEERDIPDDLYSNLQEEEKEEYYNNNNNNNNNNNEEMDSSRYVLQTRSFCRVAGGSGREHIITEKRVKFFIYWFIEFFFNF